MPKVCICYCTDVGYIFPSLVSAVQARANVAREAADIVIVALELDATASAEIGRICDAEGIRLVHVTARDVGNRSATYTRLFLDRVLPDEYDAFIYVDGDTQIRGSLDDLLRRRAQDDNVQAATDTMSFVAVLGGGAEGQRARAYLDALGFGKTDYLSYFNSGMVSAKRAEWGRIGAEAFSFTERRPELCKFHDQSALNAVLRGAVTPLSLRWNFPAFMRNCGVESEIQPALYHFCGNPRPWNGVFPPWDGRFCSPYEDILRKHETLMGYRPKAFSGRRQAKYFLQQRLKKVMETFVWRLGPFRQEILRYERGLAGPEESFAGAPLVVGA